MIKKIKGIEGNETFLDKTFLDTIANDVSFTIRATCDRTYIDKTVYPHKKREKMEKGSLWRVTSKWIEITGLYEINEDIKRKENHWSFPLCIYDDSFSCFEVVEIH